MGELLCETKHSDIRDSTTAGQVEEGISLDAQRSKISAWAEANDFDQVDIFEDADVSGKQADHRPVKPQNVCRR